MRQADSGQTIQTKIRKASSILVISILLSRVVGFFREWVLAHSVGANSMTDVYYASFTIPDFLNYLMAAGALSISFIPILAGLISEGKEETGKKVFRSVLSWMGVLLLFLVVLGELFASELAVWVAPGFTEVQNQELAFLLRIILPAQLFFYFGGLATAVQHTHGSFFMPAIAPILYNLGIVLTGILLYPSIGISSFSLGVLIGSFFSHWVLQWWGLKKLGYSIKPYFSLPDEVKNSLKQYMWLSLPLAFGFSLVVTDEWFGKYFASSMESRSISWLSYARTAMRIPIAVVGQVAAIASFPYLTRLWEQKDYGTYFETLMREVMKLWALAPLAALFMYFEAEPIVHFLYGSGRFSPEDIASTAAGLRYFSLGIVFWVYQILFSRAFFACRKTWLPSLLGGLMSIFAFPLYFYLGKNFFYQGLAVASSLSIFIYSLVLFFLWVIWMRKHHVFSFFRYVKFFFLWSCILVFLGFILLGMQKIGIYQNTRMSALSEILLLLTVLLGLALGLLRVFFQKDVGRVF